MSLASLHGGGIPRVAAQVCSSFVTSFTAPWERKNVRSSSPPSRRLVTTPGQRLAHVRSKAVWVRGRHGLVHFAQSPLVAEEDRRGPFLWAGRSEQRPPAAA